MADRAYRAAPADALRVESIGELTAIFDRRSMQTHLVVSPMPEILDAMGADACTPAQVTERLAATFNLDSTEDAQPILTERLCELAAMGLVERA
ncbi:HPr-rel-A system PqqD family peptide chaperone [Sphingopyxis sp. PAMC25046]|uniref:HPr-rel-A system PqqD family peptide chaperone n=1 Tax=Sphingopyxis sp. PAMC25046 TaxID=2565556 RepID=UPI00109E0BC2|nr:HPr-rel-A system PqqD family peptide chaperone [Sphingopyxis sp. PAMC25046]QCB55148.1 HPr-rel-A system PqqD family peptide chaperone [Sphingopyxis sp. PAMC25046]